MDSLNEYLVNRSDELIDIDAEKSIPGILCHIDKEDADWVFMFSKRNYDKMYEMAKHYEYHFGKRWVNFGDHFFNEVYKKEEYLEPYLCLSYWPSGWMCVSEVEEEVYNDFKHDSKSISKRHITIQEFIKYANISNNTLRKIIQ